MKLIIDTKYQKICSLNHEKLTALQAIGVMTKILNFTGTSLGSLIPGALSCDNQRINEMKIYR